MNVRASSLGDQCTFYQTSKQAYNLNTELFIKYPHIPARVLPASAENTVKTEQSSLKYCGLMMSAKSDLQSPYTN